MDSVKNKIIASKTLKIAVWVSLGLLALIFLIVKIHEYDIWFHLSAGKYILNNFRVPLYDPFSYTASDRFYVDFHWLYQVILYIFYSSMGFFGIFLYQLLVFGAIFFILFQISKKSNFYVVAICTLLMLLLVSPHFLFRPEMFSYLFAVLFVLILHKSSCTPLACHFTINGDPRGRNYKVFSQQHLIFLLPLLQIFWVNMHGFFIFGPIIIGCYILGEFIQFHVVARSWRANLSTKATQGVATTKNSILKSLLLTFILCVIACFINPYGYKLVVYPFLLFTEIGSGASAYTKSVHELTPTLLAEQGNYCKPAYILLIVISAASFFICKKISISRLLIYLIFLYISWVTVSNAAFFAVIVYLIIILNFEIIKEIKIPVSSEILKIAGNACLVAIILVSGSISYRIGTDKYYRYGSVIKKFGIGKVAILYPTGAIEFIKTRNITGNIFNDALLGGYFIWNCYPERKVFFDGRMEVYGEEFLSKYRGVIDNPDIYWQKIKNDYKINYVLLHPLSPHSKNLIKYLYKNKSWELTYLDESGVIFTKSDYKIKSAVKEPVLGENKIPEYLSFANFFYETEQYKKARLFYAEILKLNPDFAEAYVNLASVFMAEKKYNDAKMCYRRALQKSKKYAEPFLGLATVYLKEENYRAALDSLTFALRIKPVFPEAQLLLCHIYQKIGNFGEAIKIYKKLISRHPVDEKIHNSLGTAYYWNKNYKEALMSFKKAIEINPDFADAKKKYKICIDIMKEVHKLQ